MILIALLTGADYNTEVASLFSFPSPCEYAMLLILFIDSLLAAVLGLHVRSVDGHHLLSTCATFQMTSLMVRLRHSCQSGETC